MKVGTDGVLLGAWARFQFEPTLNNIEPTLNNIEQPLNHIEQPLNNIEPRILDIGTGTGLIALMLAQRYPNAIIDAIEIDHEAAEEARMNVENSPWKDRINVIEMSLQDYCTELENEGQTSRLKYDFIVTNPPFYNATLKPEDESRAAARHYDSLPFSEITSFCDKFLKNNGLLAVIYPTNCEENIMLGVASSSLKYLTICDVLTKTNKPCKRRMVLLQKGSSQPLKKETISIRDEDNNYTKEYIELTKEFYTHLY